MNFQGKGRSEYKSSLIPVRDTKMPIPQTLKDNKQAAKSLSNVPMISTVNKERDYLIKVLDQKIKSEFVLTDGCPVTMQEIKTFFGDLHYELTGK